MIAEFRLLLRSRLVALSLLGAFAASALSLWLGWSAIDAQHRQIETALSLQRARHAEAVAGLAEAPKDAGAVAYETFHVVVDRPGPLAWLAIGDRAVRPAAQRVRMLGLEAQIHDGEAHNPERAAAGAFDFAFVVVFLLPLLCIGLNHDLATGDREQGRGGLLASLVVSPWRFWIRRVFARYVAACAAVLLPLLLFAALSGPWRFEIALVAGAVLVHAAIWTCVCAWISLRWRLRASAANAMRMLALWAVVLLVLPAFGGAAIALHAPMPQAGEIALSHRKAVNDAWDLPKSATFEQFFRWHPEWRDTPPVLTRFHWKWYYAFHHVADRRVADAVAEAEAAMRRRDAHAAAAGIALPPVAMQRLLDDVADNGAESLLAHRAAVRAFHDRLRAYFYPYVFEERPFGPRDFAAMPRPVEARSAPRSSPLPWLGLIAWSMLAFAALMREAVAPSFSGRDRGGSRLPRRRDAAAQDAGDRV